MPPYWLDWLSIISLAAAFATAIFIIVDLRRHPQSMAVLNPVWPITRFISARSPSGPTGRWDGRRTPASMTMAARTSPSGSPHFVGSTHCGAGCTLGDIIAEFMVFFAGIAIAGSTFGAQLVFDYTFAFLLGITFQYASIVPTRGLKPIEGIIAAVKADALSLTAFEVGLFGWMAQMRFVFFHPALKPDSPVFWFMMQIGVVIGFATTFPMNWFLVKVGIKEAM